MTNSFLSSESGAVTVDWVVLTAALVGLGIAVMGVVSTGVQTASERIATQLRSDMVNNQFVNNETTDENGDGTGEFEAAGFDNNAQTTP